MPKINRYNLYLTELHLKGFKSIIDCKIRLNKGLNILIGKNGSGKSNLFEFIENIVSNYPKEINFKEAQYELVSGNEHLNRFVISYKRNAIDLDFIKENSNSRFQIIRKFEINGEKKAEGLLGEAVVDEIKLGEKTYKLGNEVGHFFLRLNYRFSPTLNLKFNLPENLVFIDKSAIIRIDLINEIWDFPNALDFITFTFWGAEIEYRSREDKDINYSTVVDFLKTLEIDDKIIENLKLYTPIQDIRFNKNINIYEEENEITIENVKLEFFVNDSWLPWSQLSDGTKRLFYIISEVTERYPGLILIEEPELGIHPHQFSLLMDFIKKESETKQIIISTHSPKALDHLDKDELDNILIASYEKSKGTQVRHLSNQEKEHAANYREEVGFLSDFWLYSSLEE